MYLKLRYGRLFKVIAIRLAWVFLVSQIAWAYPIDALHPSGVSGISKQKTQQEFLNELRRRSGIQSQKPSLETSLNVEGKEIPVRWYGPSTTVYQQWRTSFEYTSVSKKSNPKGDSASLHYDVGLILSFLQPRIGQQKRIILLNLGSGDAAFNDIEVLGDVDVTTVNIDNDLTSYVRPLPSEYAGSIEANYVNCDLSALPESIDEIKTTHKDGPIQAVTMRAGMIGWLRQYAAPAHGISGKALESIKKILGNAWSVLEGEGSYLIATEPGCHDYIPLLDVIAENLSEIIVIGDENNWEAAKAVIFCKRPQSLPTDTMLARAQAKEDTERPASGAGTTQTGEQAEEDAKPGAGATQAGVLPHRGYRQEGTVNDQIITTLKECIPGLIETGRLTLEDAKGFLAWYEEREPGSEPQEEKDKLPIDKLVDKDRKPIIASNGRRLEVVKLPVDKLGVVNARPFYGHIGLREGIIWVAEGTSQERGALDVEVDIMHEVQEYDISAEEAQRRGWSMARMALWRDARYEDDEYVGFEEASRFFDLAHLKASRKVRDNCLDEFRRFAEERDVEEGYLEEHRRRLGLSRRAQLHFGKTALAYLRKQPKVPKEFGLALSSTDDEEDFDFQEYVEGLPDKRKSLPDELAEAAKREAARDESEEEVMDWLLDYGYRAKRLMASGDETSEVAGERMLNESIPLDELIADLKAFIAGREGRRPEDIVFRKAAFVEALKGIFSPAHIRDEKGKPLDKITVSSLWDEPRPYRPLRLEAEMDEDIYRTLQLVAAHEDLIKPQARTSVIDMLLNLVLPDVTRQHDEQVTQIIYRECLKVPDIEIAAAIVKAVPRPFESLPIEPITIDTYQIKVVNGIIEAHPGAFKKGKTQEETDKTINAVRGIFLDVMQGKVTEEEATASLIWHLDNPVRPEAAAFVKLAKDARIVSMAQNPEGAEVPQPDEPDTPQGEGAAAPQPQGPAEGGPQAHQPAEAGEGQISFADTEFFSEIAQNQDLLKRWLSIWARHNNIAEPLTVACERETEPSGRHFYRLVIRDEYGSEIAHHNYNVIEKELQVGHMGVSKYVRRRLAALMRAFLILNYKVRFVSTKSLSEDGLLFAEGLRKMGIYSSFKWEGDGYNAEVNAENIELLASDEAAFQRFIAKGPIRQQEKGGSIADGSPLGEAKGKGGETKDEGFILKGRRAAEELARAIRAGEVRPFKSAHLDAVDFEGLSQAIASKLSDTVGEYALSALQDLKTENKVEFDSVILGSRYIPGQEDQFALGFCFPNHKATSDESPLQDLYRKRERTLGYATDLLEYLKTIDEKLKDTHLVAEYLLHEALETYFDHQSCRNIQRIIFPENYITPNVNDEGLLRDYLRAFVNGRFQDVTSTYEFSTPLVLHHRPSNILREVADRIRQEWGISIELELQFTEPQRTIFWFIEGPGASAVLNRLAQLNVIKQYGISSWDPVFRLSYRTGDAQVPMRLILRGGSPALRDALAQPLSALLQNRLNGLDGKLLDMDFFWDWRKEGDFHPPTYDSVFNAIRNVVEQADRLAKGEDGRKGLASPVVEAGGMSLDEQERARISAILDSCEVEFRGFIENPELWVQGVSFEAPQARLLTDPQNEIFREGESYAVERSSIKFNEGKLRGLEEGAVREVYWQAYAQWYEQELTRHFDRLAGEGLSLQRPEAFEGRVGQIKNWLRAAGLNVSGKTVLDAGTGTGAVAYAVADEGAGRVLAVDISEATLQNAKRNNEKHATKITFIRQSLLSLEGVEAADVVVAHNVLSYFPPLLRRKALEQMVRRCKEGGDIIIRETKELVFEDWNGEICKEYLQAEGCEQVVFNPEDTKDGFIVRGKRPSLQAEFAEGSPQAHQQAEPEPESYEHPLGDDREVRQEEQSLRSITDRLIGWWLSKDYPLAELLGLYRYAFSHSTVHDMPGSILAKYAETTDPNTGLPQVSFDVPTMYVTYKRCIDSVDSFILHSTYMPREAKGLVVLSVIRDEITERLIRLNALLNDQALLLFESRISSIMQEFKKSRVEAVIHLTQNLRNYPELVDFLTRNREPITEFAVYTMAEEFVEGLEQARACRWLVENGLIDPAPQKIELAFPPEKEFLSCGDDEVRILATELQQLASASIAGWANVELARFKYMNVDKIRTFFMLLQMLSYDGEKGFKAEGNMETILLKRDAPPVDEFMAPATSIIEPVRKKARELEERIARLEIPQPYKDTGVLLTASRQELLERINERARKTPGESELRPKQLNEILDGVFPKVIGLDMYLQAGDAFQFRVALTADKYSFVTDAQTQMLMAQKRTERIALGRGGGSIADGKGGETKDEGFILKGRQAAEELARAIEAEEVRPFQSTYLDVVDFEGLSQAIASKLSDTVGEDVLSALQDLKTKNKVEFDSIILGSRYIPGQEDQFALGFCVPNDEGPLQGLYRKRERTLGYATDLLEYLKTIDEKLKDTHLVAEYLLHEALEIYFDHQSCRNIQRIIFPENYITRDDEGILRDYLRAFVNGRFQEVTSTYEFSTPLVLHHRPSDILRETADRIREKWDISVEIEIGLTEPQRTIFWFIEGWDVRAVLRPLAHLGVIGSSMGPYFRLLYKTHNAHVPMRLILRGGEPALRDALAQPLSALLQNRLEDSNGELFDMDFTVRSVKGSYNPPTYDAVFDAICYAVEQADRLAKEKGEHKGLASPVAAEAGEGQVPFGDKGSFSTAKRRQWAVSLVESVRAEAKKLRQEKKRLAIAIDTSIANLEEHGYELIRALEEMAEEEGLKDVLDVITGEGPTLRLDTHTYLKRNRNAIVRGIVRAEDAEQCNTLFGNYKERIRLVAVDDSKTPNRDTKDCYYIPLIPIIRSSLTGGLEPIPYASQRRLTEGDIITSIITLEPAEPIPMDELEGRLREDAIFVGNA